MLATALAAALTLPPGAAADPGAVSAPARVLVRFRGSVSAVERERTHRRAEGTARRRFDAPRGLELVELPAGVSVSEALARYGRDASVERVEPDWPIEVHSVPNDPSFGEQWYLENFGQSGGAVDADINAPGAWDLTTGGSAVVAVIDSGIDYTHPDLAANVWTNPGEVPANGVDDDGNGYVDDVHGIDALTGSGDPMDDLGHGTQMSGLVAAVGNNGIGVAGVGWRTRVLACKAIDARASGKLSAVLACMDYIRALKTRAAAPVDIVAINASWGGIPYSRELAEAIAATHEAGILFVASAGNGGASVEDPTSRAYPGRFGLPLVVSVGASDASDRLAPISDHGGTSVHLLAPGSSLLVPTMGGGYGSGSGTSHAAALASGVAALVAADSPGLRPAQLALRLLAGAQPTAGAAGVTATGARLRAFDTGGIGALTCAERTVAMRVAPPGEAIFSVRGRSRVPLAVLHAGCDGPAAAPVVAAGGAVTLLADGGAGADLFAGDGVYAGTWAVPGDAAATSHSLAFSGGDEVTVRVLDAYHDPEAIPFEWRTITGRALTLADDTAVAITSPFPVPFGHGPGFTTVWVHSNGYLELSGTVPSASNEPLPSRRLGVALAPFWDDLDPGVAGSVVWDVAGTAPARELVVEWAGVPHHDGGGDGLAFQVVLFEDRADVVFSYADVTVGAAAVDGGASATVGIQAAPPWSGGVARTFSSNAPALVAGTSLLWRANEPPLASAGRSVVVRSGRVAVLDGSASLDPDGTSVSYAWRQTGGPGVVLATPEAAVTSFVAPPAPAVIELELAVTDADGAVSRARAQVAVDDAALAIDIVPPATPAAEGSEVSVELVVSSAEGAAGGPFAVSWSWGDGASDAVTLAAPGSFLVRHAYADGDGTALELRAEVSDRAGDDGSPGPASRTSATRLAMIVLNVPPRVEGVYVSPWQASVGRPVTIGLAASDPGVDAITYSFDVDGDGAFDVVDAAAPEVVTTYARAGTRRLTVLARDEDGGEDRAVADVRVSDRSESEGACGCREATSPSTTGVVALLLLILLRAGRWRRAGRSARRAVASRPSGPG